MKHKLSRVVSLLLVFCMMMSFIPAIQPAQAANPAFSYNLENYVDGENFVTHSCTGTPNIKMTVTQKATATTYGQLHLECLTCGAIDILSIPKFNADVFNLSIDPECYYDGQPHYIAFETKDGPFDAGDSTSWSKDLFILNGKIQDSFPYTHAGYYSQTFEFSKGLKFEDQPVESVVYLYDEFLTFGNLIIKPRYTSIPSFPQWQYKTDGTASNNIMTIWRNVTMPAINNGEFTLDSYIYPASAIQQSGIDSITNWSQDRGATALTSISSPGVYVVDLVIPNHNGETVSGYTTDYQIDTSVNMERRLAVYMFPVQVSGQTVDTVGIGYRTYFTVAPDKVSPLYVGDSIDSILKSPYSLAQNFQLAIYPGANNEYANVTAKAGTYTVPLRFVDPNTGVAVTTTPIDVEVKKYEAASVEPLDVIVDVPVGTEMGDIPWPTVNVITKPRDDTGQAVTIRGVPAQFHTRQGVNYDPYSTSEQTFWGYLTLPGSEFNDILSDPDNIEFPIRIRLKANTNASCTFEDASKPYTGQPIPHEISNAVGIASATYVYEGINGTSYGPTSEPPTERGTYRVTATLTMGPGFAQIGPLTATLTVTKGLQFLPNAATTPKLQASDFTTITLQEASPDPYGGTYEYGILVDGQPQWQDSRVFTGLEPDTAYTFVQRLKETDTKGPSPTSEQATFRTRDFDMTAAVTSTKTTATVPDTVTLTASCEHGLGADPSIVLTYQWYKNGIAIPGATGQTITLSDPSESGFYSCSVTLTRGSTKKTAESNQLRVTITAKSTVMALLPDNWRDYLLLDTLTYGQKLSDTRIRIDGSKMQIEHPECNQALYLTIRFLEPDIVPTVPSSLTGAGVYDIEISFVDDSYDTVTETIPETMLTVKPAPLTIRVGNTTLTYGDNPSVALSSASLSYEGFVNGDTAASMEGTPVFTGGYTEQWKDLPYSGSSYVTVSGLTNPNYNITVEPGALTFQKLMVTVEPTGTTSKIYGAADPRNFGMKAVGIDSYPEDVQEKIQDELDMLEPLTRQAGENVGIYHFELEPYDSSRNFTFQATTDVQFYINPRPADVIWELDGTPVTNAGSLVYTGNDLSEKVKAYYLDKDGTRIDLTVAFTQNGSAATLLEEGSYLAGATDTSAGRNNYSLNQHTLMLTVAPGGSQEPTDYVTFPTASDISQGSLLKDSILTGGNGGPNGDGTYTWKTPDYVPAEGTWSFDVVFTPSANDPTDYSREPGFDPETGTVTRQVQINVVKRMAVDKDALEITSVKTYDGTRNVAVLAADAIQIAQGDDVSVTITATFDSANAGTNKTITVHIELSGKDAGKYQVPDDFTISGEIRKAPLTIQAPTLSLSYGDSLTSPDLLSLQAEGFVKGESITNLSGNAIYDYDGYEQWDDVFEGVRPITVSGFSSSNYEITYKPGTFSVSKRLVTIRPSAANTKVFGDPDPILQYSLDHTLGNNIPEAVQTQLSEGVRLVRAEGESVGSYAYRNDAPESKNFTFQISESYQFTITKRTVILTWYGLNIPYEEDGTDQSSKIRAVYEPEDSPPIQATLSFVKSGSNTPSTFETAGFYEVTADLGPSFIITNPKETVQMLSKSEQGVSDPSVKEVSETSIELNPIENGQYSKDGGNTWQDSPLFEGLEPDTVYPMRQRIPDGNGGYLESNTVNVSTNEPEPEPEPPAAPTIREKDDTSVTVQPIPDGEYSIDGGKTWQTSPVFDGLTPETTYSIIQRIPHPKNPNTYLVSEPTQVTTDPDSTPVRPEAPVIDSKTHNTVTVKPIENGQYSIDGGVTWQNGTTFTGLTPETDYQIIQRIPDGKGGYLISDPTHVTTNEDPNKPQKPAAPIIDDATATTITVHPITDGQYSIDGGKTWQDNNTFTGLTPETEYEIIQRIPDGNGGYLVSDPTAVTTPASGDVFVPEIPDPVISAVSETSITVKAIEDGEYSIDGGRTWQSSPTFTGLNPDTTYTVMQRIPHPKDPASYVVSNPVSVKTNAPQPVRPAKPAHPVIQDKDDTSITVKPIEDGEYSIDGGKTWQTSPVFKGLTPDTEYEIIQRIPDPTAPGTYIESDPTIVTTDPAAGADVQNPDQPVIEKVTDTSVTVRPISGGEYSIDGGKTWQENPVFDGLTPNTRYDIIQRIPHPNNPGEYLESEPTHVITNPAPGSNKPANPIVEEVTETSITVKPIENGEYSIDGGKTWQENPVFDDLTPDTDYEIIQRVPDPANPGGYLESNPTYVTTDKDTGSNPPEPDTPVEPIEPTKPEKPAKPTVDEITEISITLKPIPDGEYSIDGGTTWQPDPYFPGLQPDTEYEIIQRIPDPTSPGEYIESDPTQVKTDVEDVDIDDPVVVSKSDSTIILQPIPAGEYSIDGGRTWQKSPAFLGLDANTTYDVVQRQPGATRYKVSNTIQVTTDEKPQSGSLDISINCPDETIDFDPDPGFLVIGDGGVELHPGDNIKPGESITIVDKETGDETTITIPRRPTAPDVSLDTKQETINTKPNMEYSTDGGYTWLPAPDGLPVNGMEGSTILVRYPATEGSFSSNPAEVSIPNRGEGPIVTTKPATSATNKDGALLGTTSDMEYSPDGGLTWYPCGSGSTTNLPAGTYLIRYQATQYSLASRPSITVIGVKSPVITGTTTPSGDAFDDPDTKYGHFVQPGRPWGAGTGNPNMTDGQTTTILDGDTALSGIVGCPSAGYTDIDQSQWYHDAVDFTVANQLMIGYSATEWGPNREMTRFQMVQVLYRLAGTPEGYTLEGVTDIPDSHWAYKALAWAYGTGIVKGISDTQFAPDAPITYEQMATMIYNFCSLYGLNYVTGTATTEYDRNEVSDYAQAPMTVVSAAGIFNVHGTTSVSAKGTMTRATAAQVITNFCTLYNSQIQSNESINGTQQATYTNPGVMDNVTHVLYT